MKFRWILIPLLFISATALRAGPPAAGRIVFLGDSITQSGRYIEIIEAAHIAQFPNSHNVIIPLGLASETVSGLSEPGHAGGKFPRPDLHERLDRVLEKAKPDLVIACYGMNDGIYHPLSRERTRAFQDGMRRLHDKVTKTGARINHLTPPVFDPLPIKSRVLPAGLDRYPHHARINRGRWAMRQKTWHVSDEAAPASTEAPAPVRPVGGPA